jgi:putative sigma-54 modulation protein
VQINIATRHGHLSEASQTKLTSKLEKLSRIFDRLTSIELTVDLEDSQRPRVDLLVSAEHKHDFVAHGHADSLQGAVESVISKVEQQLRKYKQKVQSKHRDAETRRREAMEAGPAPLTEEEQRALDLD